MHIELISKCTVKVSLTAADMELFELCYEDIEESSPETRKLIVYILDELNRMKGIDLSKEKLFIEVFPSFSGGCLMYISNSSGTLLHEKGSTEPTEIVFSFGSIGRLTDFAHRLIKAVGKNILSSSLYISEKDIRLIVGIEDAHSLSELKKRFKAEGSSILAAHTREHYREILSENAVERLSEL